MEQYYNTITIYCKGMLVEQYYNTITIYATNSSIYKKGGRVSNLNVLTKSVH